MTRCSTATATEANRANCNYAVGFPTDVGGYARSASPYGTFDQGGNVWEWNELVVNVSSRGMRGGAFDSSMLTLAAANRTGAYADSESVKRGFRIAMIPEPGTSLLLIAGLLGLGGWRRACT